MVMVSFNVIICGGGLGGLACAIGLKKKGHNVTVLEASSTLSEVGAGIQVPPNSVKILKEYGIFDKFEKLVTRPKNIILRRYDTGAPLSTTPLDPDMTETYGNPYLLIHRADYQRFLLEAATELGITYKTGCRVKEVDPETATVHLESGESYTGDVVVGADGIRSKVRDTAVVTEEVVSPLPSSNCAFRATVPKEEMLSDPVIAHLMTDVNSNCWIGYRRHVMAYPIRNGEMYNIVMSHPGQASVGKWNEPGDVNEMRNHYKTFDPVVRQLLTHVKSVLKWVLADLPKLPRWVSKSGKVVLIGDAAHAMLPYLAQGAAQAIEDGATLAEELDKITSVSEIPTALLSYQKLRKRRPETIQAGARKNGDIWHLPDGEEQEERDALMNARDGHNPDQWSDREFQQWLFGWDAFTSTYPKA
ncbi:salicylate hydroxylase [Spathaspora passalidarum NRRL Y-27907]|uniref:Salicylate hydroxylase n=1 Tax=Spathaspora passalidarum (strain NRRL Y-27907 / 11-Y1) TaxID=619300 RepID=G3AE30_SPAPN|nr:salicylate hydroxylase [Spathaspora passalidarum NRRL Y-27907]EGW35564.1 salicylate hydroxylase [Spathaspora passalidarum NRRL Y-27907]